MVGGVHRQSGGHRSACTRTHFSGLRFGTSYESGIKIKEASLPKRPKLRSLPANQNDKGSLQKTLWRSRTSCRKVWWLDYGWSQGPQWGMWIKRQSPVRCRGSGSCHSMDSILINRHFTGVWQIMWRSIMESPHFDTSSIRDKWHRWESRSTVKEGTSAVLLQSGLDERWWSGSIECCCCLRNVQDLLTDKTHYERRFGEPFKWAKIPFVAMVEYHPISARDPSRLHQFVKKVLPGIFLGCELFAGNWKGDILIADLEDLERLEASEIYHRKRRIDETKRWRIHISSSRWKQQHCQEGTTNSENQLQGGNRPYGAKISVDFSRRTGRVSTDRNDRWRLKPVPTSFWSIQVSSSQWTSSSTQCAEGRNIHYSTEIHWCNKVYSYWFGRHARNTYWWLVEDRFEQKFFELLQRIQEVHTIARKTSQGIYVVQEKTDKYSNDYLTRSCMARSMDENRYSRSESRKSGMDYRETEARQCSETERNLLYRSWRWRMQRNSQ